MQNVQGFIYDTIKKVRDVLQIRYYDIYLRPYKTKFNNNCRYTKYLLTSF